MARSNGSAGAAYSGSVQQAQPSKANTHGLPTVGAQVGGQPACTVAQWGASLGYHGSASSGIRQYLRNTGLRARQFGSWPAFTLQQHKYLVQHAPLASAGDTTAQANLIALCSMAHAGNPGTPTSKGAPAGVQLVQPTLPGKVARAAQQGAQQAKQVAGTTPSKEATAQSK